MEAAGGAPVPRLASPHRELLFDGGAPSGEVAGGQASWAAVPTGVANLGEPPPPPPPQLLPHALTGEEMVSHISQPLLVMERRREWW